MKKVFRHIVVLFLLIGFSSNLLMSVTELETKKVKKASKKAAKRKPPIAKQISNIEKDIRNVRDKETREALEKIIQLLRRMNRIIPRIRRKGRKGAIAKKAGIKKSEVKVGEKKEKGSEVSDEFEIVMLKDVEEETEGVETEEKIGG